MNVKKFLQGQILRHLPTLTSRGRLIYHSPVDHLLRGYWVETSAFVEGKFSITAFAQIMAVPTTVVTLSFGRRLGNGSDKWWTLAEGNEAELAQDVLSRLRAEEATLFGRIRDLSSFVSTYASANQETSDIRGAEALFYALVLLDRDAEAARIVTHLAQIPNGTAWQAQLLARLTRDATDLLVDRPALLKRIAVQEQNTRKALRVE